MHQIWLTAIGRDRPGIVARIARVLLQHGLNIEDSQMRILGGRFAMMLLLRGETNEEALVRDLLNAGRELGLDYIYVHPIEETAAAPPEPTHVLTVYGGDHPGIVAGVAGALADLDVNITDLQTRLAEGVYVMFLELAIPADVDLDEAIAKVGREQGVDASLRKLERDAL
ncbi:MAG: glycine cleavage system protein R [Thermoleophilaceae bacterium]